MNKTHFALTHSNINVEGFPAQIGSLPVAEHRAAAIAPAPGSVDPCAVGYVLTAMK